jgi:hypothetical protein
MFGYFMTLVEYDENVTETLLGKQLSDFNFEENMQLLNIDVECWLF